MIDEFCEQQLSDNDSTPKTWDRKRRRETDCALLSTTCCCMDIIMIGINRNHEFEQLPHNVHAGEVQQ